MSNFYLIPIVFLLPLSSLFVVVQVNPYNALVMRGILGAVTALVYAVLGAADVSLTDALVGTMLSITLYAIAVRSSLSMSIGGVGLKKQDPNLSPIQSSLKQKFMRLEVISYDDEDSLMQALESNEIHSAYLEREELQLLIRIPRLYEMLSNLTEFKVILAQKNP